MELVEACKTNHQRGLACLLTEPCLPPTSYQNIQFGLNGKWEIPRTDLSEEKNWKELERGAFGIVYKGNHFLNTREIR